MPSGGADGDGGGRGEGLGLGEDQKEEAEEQQRDLITLKRALLGNRMEGVLGIQEQGTVLQPDPRRAGSSELKSNRDGTEDEDESDVSEQSILHPGFSNMFGLSELAKTLTPRSSRELPALSSPLCWNYRWICF